MDKFTATIASLLIMILAVLDAKFTLLLIESGKSYEANPIMAYFLLLGVGQFLAAKFTLTVIGVTALYVQRNNRVSRIGYPLVLFTYSMLVLYEVYCLVI